MTDGSREASIGSRIDVQPDGCWLWTGGTTGSGYAADSQAGRVHRYVYEVLVGPIPHGHVLRRSCPLKACVNPEHWTPSCS